MNTLILTGEHGGIRTVRDTSDINFHFRNSEIVTVKDDAGNIVYYGKAGRAAAYLKTKGIGSGRRTTDKW